ncbi:MAG TPA: carboxymuconolactone decarboxylase family protein [Longimicrobiaceae bacterium]|nr:carboxymuconolactone decarboxylase family protein [Longimicrobiaceae bacterium]
MEPRIDYRTVAPDAMKTMFQFQQSVGQTDLEHNLIELVKLRASQINGCGYCLDMHSKDALAMGEDEQRIYVLSAWREAPFYSDRERAALAWTEAVTEIGKAGVSDELYEETLAQFSEKEIVDLTMIVIAINAWNRLAVPFRAEVGSYQPQKKVPAA